MLGRLRRLSRFALLIALALALLARDSAPESVRPVLAGNALVTATPIALDPEDPRRTTVGRLRFLAGWELTSRDPAFGSISAMAVDGEGLLLLSDAGGVVRLTLDPVRAVFSDLPAGPGAGTAKRDRDSEALVVSGGKAWVAFEAHNAIWRYDRALSRSEASARPAAMRRWPGNGGAEAMVRLRDGRFVVFAERGRAPPGAAPALIFDRDPTDANARVSEFFHRAPTDYRITDTALLPGRELLLLHRRIGLLPYLSAKLTVLPVAAIKEGEVALGEEVARLAPPLAVDNMEALAVTRENGETIVWIASDDNFGAPLQRTLLLKFRLLPRAS